MTNEECIKKLKSIRNDYIKIISCEALDMAIESMRELEKLKQFTHFVAESVMEDDFTINGIFYAEVFCRKLNKLGIIREDGENWVYDEGDEDDDDR